MHTRLNFFNDSGSFIIQEEDKYNDYPLVFHKRAGYHIEAPLAVLDIIHLGSTPGRKPPTAVRIIV